MSEANPYYVVHFYSENRFGEHFNIGSAGCPHKHKSGKTYVLFNSRWYLVRGILKKITVNDEGRKLEFSVSCIDH